MSEEEEWRCVCSQGVARGSCSYLSVHVKVECTGKEAMRRTCPLWSTSEAIYELLEFLEEVSKGTRGGLT